jgi:hypothetical protein
MPRSASGTASCRYPLLAVPTEIVCPEGRGSVTQEQIPMITRAARSLTIALQNSAGFHLTYQTGHVTLQIDECPSKTKDSWTA